MYYEFSMPLQYCTSPGVMVLLITLVVVVAVGLELVPVVVVVLVVVHMYVAGSVLQCPSVQLAVMVTLGNKPSSQVKVMDDPTNVVV